MLEVAGLRAGYGPIEVLRGPSLRVGSGELVALLGASGAGKTTLLRTVSGLVRSTGGTVVLVDEDITNAPPHHISRLGLVHVPEGRRLFPRMTVQENLDLGAMPGEPMRRRDVTRGEVFARFPVLADRRRQLAGTLSGGEQQQLAIGRGLMGRPRLLVLDEPTLGLAPLLAAQIIDRIAALRGDGLTVLVVSQEVASVLEIADRAYVLENGPIVLEGTAADLVRRDEVRAAYLGM
jgi:branched-chain amino acid transport system ATP-binding protein